MLKFGYISELIVDKGLARVHFTDDDIVTNPLPVSVQASKEDKYSFPFAINEHVWCLMDDNCEFGVIGGAIYSAKNTPVSGVGEQLINIDIGANKLQIKIDKSGGHLEMKLEGDVSIEALGDTIVKGNQVNVEAQSTATVKGTSVTIDAPTATFTGDITVSGTIQAGTDVQAGGKSLVLHTHIAPPNGGATSPPL